MPQGIIRDAQLRGKATQFVSRIPGAHFQPRRSVQQSRAPCLSDLLSSKCPTDRRSAATMSKTRSRDYGWPRDVLSRKLDPNSSRYHGLNHDVAIVE